MTVVDKKVRDLRGLFTTYKLQNKILVQLKNRIKSLLRQCGCPFEVKNFNKLDSFLESNPVSEIIRSEIKLLMQQMNGVYAILTELLKMIYRLGNELFPNQIKKLLSIPGFSPLTAITAMSDIVDIDRFPNVKKFCAYLRTAPRVSSSNDTTHLGKVNKKARSTTCSLMTQSVKHFKEASLFHKEFYARVRQGKSAGKSRMALIRKMLVSVYFMLKRDTLFYDVNTEKYNRKIDAFNKILTKGTEKAAA